MTLVAIPGVGVYLPRVDVRASTYELLDETTEELQMLYSITTEGSGPKTFGTSGSALQWYTRHAATLPAGWTLRVGIKSAAQISTTAGAPARATPGGAAFSVYKDLVGGTDTVTTYNCQTTVMNAGTPLTVNDGDLLAMCWLLTGAGAAPAVTIHGSGGANVYHFPGTTLITAGPVYTQSSLGANAMLVFDDGSLGWGEPSFLSLNVFGEVVEGQSVGDNFGNVFRVPFPCAVDLLEAYVITPSTSGPGDFALILYSDPLGTPVALATATHDASLMMTTDAYRRVVRRLPVPQTLLPGTDYAIALKLLATGALTLLAYDVHTPTHFKPNGLDETCYAAKSTGGAFVKSSNANAVLGARRYYIWARLSHVDDGAGAGGGGMRLVGAGGLAG